jgi:hypothetical protein
MKFSQAALLSFLVTATATSTTSTAFVASPSLVRPRNAISLAATVEKEKDQASSSSAAVPVREAPGAGYVPAWENRSGLTQQAFLNSDMTKPDISAMWECPLTRWDYKE